MPRSCSQYHGSVDTSNLFPFLLTYAAVQSSSHRSRQSEKAVVVALVVPSQNTIQHLFQSLECQARQQFRLLLTIVMLPLWTFTGLLSAQPRNGIAIQGRMLPPLNSYLPHLVHPMKEKGNVLLYGGWHLFIPHQERRKTMALRRCSSINNSKRWSFPFTLAWWASSI